MAEIVRSVCQGCHVECGVLAHVEGGEIIKIEGDPEHPMNRGFTCVKGRAQNEVAHHPDRLKYPLRRSGERGSGKWERISWDEALDGIAEKLTEVRDQYAPESIGFIHGTGPRSSLYSTPLLATALGTPNVISVDLHICYIPSLTGEKWTYGTSILMEQGPEYLNADCIMVMGGNPLNSHPARGIEILEARKKRGTKLIVVDPRRIELAAKADLWLQIRPGTDVALTLGMMRVIIEEELYDKDFVEKWCHGFDALTERVKEYPLEKVSEITWIPVDQIKEAARLYATTKPAVMHHRVAIEHNLNSVQTCRALGILVALTGNLDVPGGNVLPMSHEGLIPQHSLWESPRFRLPPEKESKRIGADIYPLVSGPESVLPFVVGPLANETIRTGKPYPIKALFCAGGNPIVNMQDVKRLWESYKRDLDLIVVADFFMTPTAELADYVLPAAAWMERDEMCELSYVNYISARQKVVEPPGECWHDLKMSLELAKRIPWADRNYLPWEDVDAFNDAMVEGMGITFEELKGKSFDMVPMEYRKYEKDGFNTPTGKVEIFSTEFERRGYDPLPFFREPPESPVSTPELLDEYPYILYTGSRHIEYFHSEGRQIKTLRDRVPDPLLEIHPETAERENMKDGDWVWIETPQVKGERVKFRVKVTDTIHPKMVHTRHGWWFPERPAPERGCFDSNINVVMTDDPPREDICGSVRTRGTLCKIYT
ncbi:MAG: molybdopterin-dependent oxidoreductase [Deltaproteobacteria bacterium]|nr:molybdopterin-dependent oxidoreductase [Deltaproteobacteria bacterium]